MITIRCFLAGSLLTCVATSLLADDAPRKTSEDFFETHVRPLLVENCMECHGADTQEGGLRLDDGPALFQGGDSGPVVRPGQPDESRLILLIRGDDKELSMPPGQRMDASQIEILERWVRDGAVWPGHDPPNVSARQVNGPQFSTAQKAFWSFQPLAPATVPRIADEWIATPVDAFIRDRLRQTRMEPAAPASKQELIRRVTFDLTGLPPTPDEIDAFLRDASPDAYEKLLDRLLASKRYGERWGRHWLDVVRFAESAAHDGNNGYLHAWRYRDYVIDAFNSDMPVDQFIVEQLAGDLLPKTGDVAVDMRRLIATGFLQVGPKPVVMRDKQQMLLDIADEQLSTTGVAFLGLSLGCARCHSHKFDPIPIDDYYSLAGIFTSTHVMLDDAADSMWIEPEVAGPNGDVVRVMAVADFPEAKNLRVHLRGNYRTLGDEVPRRFLQIVAGEDHAAIETAGSGRLELARWIASPSHPLTARVYVNRVWQNHFGRGIVATADDFGSRGERPTHPELLDWLARYFIDSGWSTKRLHKLLLLSNTYRQTSHREPRDIDPENSLVARMPRRRLSAEEIRDSLLAISGSLDEQMGGTLFTSGFNFNRPDVKLSVVDVGQVETYAPYLAPRRAIYLPMLRNQMNPMLTLFDMANEHLPVAGRRESVVATQSLFWMNSPFVRQQAARLAETTQDLGDELRIHRLWRRVLGREPSAQDVAEALQFLASYRTVLASETPASSGMPESSPPPAPDARIWLSYCQALFCLNEFIYVD